MPSALDLAYLGAEAVPAYLEEHKGRVLGLVAFGAAKGVTGEPMLPAPVLVDIPVLGSGGASFEVWTSSRPVIPCGAGNIAAHTDGEVLFGAMRLEQTADATLEALSRQAYLEIFSFLDRQRCRSLLRVWNYLPRINQPEDGLERYRCFNKGRHEAYVASGRDISADNVPAASVLGCDGGPMVIYFLASSEPGKPIDNPRQVAAYRYPERYGPRSPIFVRAMQTTSGRRPCLFVSGTASIVGHETLHEGNVGRQAVETMHNIRILLDQAGLAGTADGHMELKIYVRHAQDMERVREQVQDVLGAGDRSVYLRSDICRADLLMEIEAVQFGDTRP